MKIAFVTHPGHPEIEDDDRPLAEALARRGALALASSWDDPDFDWSSVDLALIRSSWDYYRRYDEFLAWLERVEVQTRVVNPPPVVRWNASKRYLLDLSLKGVHVIPTHFIARGQTARLGEVCAERGWDTVVLKPTVSANSWETILIPPSDHARGQAYLERHLPDREIMVQPFMRDVDAGGEQSLMFFGGGYSHAVRKTPPFKEGPRTEPEGIPVEAAPDFIEMAADVLAGAGLSDLPYARVDLARDGSGRPILFELELFEPTLFFREKPGSEEALADLLAAQCREEIRRAGPRPT